MAICEFEDCRNHAIFGSEFCWEHLKDHQAYRKNLLSSIKESPSLKEANLAKVDLSNFDLARIDLSYANLSRVNLSDSNLFDANMENAELVGANLTGCDLTSANLQGADLTRCDLRGARLWHANLENTTLIEANLSDCDLWNAKLFNTRLWRTNISQAVSLSKKNFEAGPNRFYPVYQINEKGTLSAEEAYRDLKKHFLSNGRYDDASWASFKEKTMEKILLKKDKNLAYLPSLIMDLLCGYGEKPHRIILSSFSVIILYAVMFKLFNAIMYADSPAYAMSIGDYIYYSIVTFTTVGYGDFIPKAAFLFRFLAASEAFIGVFMIGLFIFTLARKYSAR